MKQFLILLTTIFIWTCSSSPTKSEPAPQPPTVNNLSITTNEDTPTTFTMTGADPEGAALTFSISTQPQYGTVHSLLEFNNFFKKGENNEKDINITFIFSNQLSVKLWRNAKTSWSSFK